MKRNKKKNLKLIVLSLILLLGLGFAALAANLKIDGTVNVAKTSWDVHFENVQVTEGSVEANPAPTSDDTTTTEMTYTINFTKPGDFFEFTTDIVNDGTIDAMVDVVSNNAYASAASTTPITLPTYLTNTLTYNDGVPIDQNQLLAHGTSEKIKVRIEFKKDIQASDLPSSGDTSVVFKFVGDYKQADGNAKVRMKICDDNENITVLSSNSCSANENVTIPTGTICKRAINLHQEECTQINNIYLCSGAGYTPSGIKGTSIITYGSCGNRGSNLVSGDALTCDVNGDGVYDELLERFYYVSDYYDTTEKTFDTTTATLVYYNNVAEGVSCNKNTYAYDSSDENWHGPVTAMGQLPTISQWSNVSLKSEFRAILAEYQATHDSPTTRGGTLPTAYSYSGYAARLLTAKELMSGCNLTQVGNYTDGELDSCNYLLENTSFANNEIMNGGHWIETPLANNNFAWYIISRHLSNNNTNYSSLLGVRPVIEVPKSKISY